VHPERAVDEPVDYERPVFSYHSRKLTATGALGRPRSASADKGRAILAWVVEDLVALVERARKEPMPDDVWQVKRD
jgi:creatinine amidohydrolase/Fe(II)-dependent formamide hydrolase-like protein